MSRPSGFTWIDKPHLAALARPESVEEMTWLRQQGIEVLLSLTEDPPRRDWVDEAGLLVCVCVYLKVPGKSSGA